MKSYGVTIQMKATEQYFPVVLFIMLYKVVLTFESADEILWCDHSNESSLCLVSHGAFRFFKISQNDIWKFGCNLLLAKFGSERINHSLDCYISHFALFSFLIYPSHSKISSSITDPTSQGSHKRSSPAYYIIPATFIQQRKIQPTELLGCSLFTSYLLHLPSNLKSLWKPWLLVPKSSIQPPSPYH